MPEDNVRSTWDDWNTRFEGHVDGLYLDVKGYVTGGVGNLLENIKTGAPVLRVFNLPWRHRSDDTLAAPDTVRAEWHLVKSRQDLKNASLARRLAITTLYLRDADIRALVLQKYDEDHTILKIQFPELETWPWSAQRALHSMAWARGPYAFAVEYPRFTAACLTKNWTVAAAECHINDVGNPGLTPRNAANKALFEEAIIAGLKLYAAPAPPPKPTITQRFMNWWRS